MEKKGVLLPLLIAIGAAFIYWMVLTSKEMALSSSLEKTKVIVARTDLPARTVLKEDLVEVLDMPKKYIQSDAYEVRTGADIKMVANLVTAIRIPKGNQVTTSALIPLNPEAGLSVKVPPGYRGATLEVSNELLKLIKPNDRIDVLVTFEAVMADGKKEKVTATILQNVLVLGVGGNLGQGMSGDQARMKQQSAADAQAFSDKGVLSLALNPNEAQYLALSQKVGEGGLSVVLRGLGDLEMHPMEMASFRKLFTR